MKSIKFLSFFSLIILLLCDTEIVEAECPVYSFTTGPGELCSGDPFTDIGVEIIYDSGGPFYQSELYYSDVKDFDPYAGEGTWMPSGFAGYNIFNKSCEAKNMYVRAAFIGIDWDGTIFSDPPEDPGCRPISTPIEIFVYPDVGIDVQIWQNNCNYQVCIPCPGFTIEGQSPDEIPNDPDLNSDEYFCISGTSEIGEFLNFSISNGNDKCDRTSGAQSMCEEEQPCDELPQIITYYECNHLNQEAKWFAHILGGKSPYQISFGGTVNNAGEKFNIPAGITGFGVTDAEGCVGNTTLETIMCEDCGITNPPEFDDEEAIICVGDTDYDLAFGVVEPWPFYHRFLITDKNTGTIIFMSDDNVWDIDFSIFDEGTYCIYGTGTQSHPYSLLDIKTGETNIELVQNAIEAGLCMDISDCFSLTVSTDSPPCVTNDIIKHKSYEVKLQLDNVFVVSRNNIQLSLSSQDYQKINLSLYDISGKQVGISSQHLLNKGKQQINLALPLQLRAGVYVLQLQDGRGNFVSKKVVVF